MIGLSIIRDLVAIFGVIAGFSYYVLTVRATRKNQELVLKAQEQALETRQTQLFMSIYEVYRGIDFRRQWYGTSSWSWVGFDDFMSKYGSEADPEAFSVYHALLGYFEGVGMLVRKGFIDIEMVEDLLDIPAASIWTRFKDIVYRSREKRD